MESCTCRCCCCCGGPPYHHHPLPGMRTWWMVGAAFTLTERTCSPAYLFSRFVRIKWGPPVLPSGLSESLCETPCFLSSLSSASLWWTKHHLADFKALVGVFAENCGIQLAKNSVVHGLVKVWHPMACYLSMQLNSTFRLWCFFGVSWLWTFEEVALTSREMA